jgi:hypothetical protein
MISTTILNDGAQSVKIPLSDRKGKFLAILVTTVAIAIPMLLNFRYGTEMWTSEWIIWNILGGIIFLLFDITKIYFALKYAIFYWIVKIYILAWANIVLFLVLTILSIAITASFWHLQNNQAHIANIENEPIIQELIQQRDDIQARIDGLLITSNGTNTLEVNAARDAFETFKLKKTKNSQGQEVLIGDYIIGECENPNKGYYNKKHCAEYLSLKKAINLAKSGAAKQALIANLQAKKGEINEKIIQRKRDLLNKKPFFHMFYISLGIAILLELLGFTLKISMYVSDSKNIAIAIARFGTQTPLQQEEVIYITPNGAVLQSEQSDSFALTQDKPKTQQEEKTKFSSPMEPDNFNKLKPLMVDAIKKAIESGELTGKLPQHKIQEYLVNQGFSCGLGGGKLGTIVEKLKDLGLVVLDGSRSVRVAT